MVRIRQIQTENKTCFFLKKILGKFWVANPNFMDETFKVRKKCPVSANGKLTAFIK
jgi:hypothetical protein